MSELELDKLSEFISDQLNQTESNGGLSDEAFNKLVNTTADIMCQILTKEEVQE